MPSTRCRVKTCGKCLAFWVGLVYYGMVLLFGYGAAQFTGQQDAESIGNTCHIYGIDAFINYDFQGSEFSIEETLSVTNAYTRYRIGYMSNDVYVSGILNIPFGEGPFPLVILNHGYIDPRVYTNGRGLKREQDYLARQGFAVLHTDYRNHAFGNNDQELIANPQHRNFFYGADAINAILAVQESSLEVLQAIDADRVGMLGHSMGGGVTMASAVAKPELIDAGVLYAPVHSNDFYNYQRRGQNRLNDQDTLDFASEIGPLNLSGSFLELSPQYRFDRMTMPFQIYHGTNDDSTPIQRAYDIEAAFIDADVEYELVVYQGEVHEFVSQWYAFMEGVTTFFNENL